MSLTPWQRRAPDHTMTQDDTGFVVEETLYDNRGAVVDLSGPATIRYTLWMPGAVTAEVDAAASIIGAPTNGQVRYTFTAADTDTAGTYLEQWKVTFSGGSVQRFPTEPHKVKIRRKVAT